MMNILILCDLHPDRPWIRDRVPGLLKSIKNCKNKVFIEDIYNFFGPEVKSLLKESNIRNLNLLKPNIIESENYFKSKLNKYEVDLIIFCTADNYREFLTIDFIFELKSLGYKLIGFLGDDEFNYKQYKYLAAVFDNFVVYVHKYLKWYVKKTGNNGFLILNSCHIDNFNKIILKPKTIYDTVLIGGPIHDRVKILRKLKKLGYSIAIYGPKTWLNFNDLKENYLGFVSSQEFDKKLSEGKIILSMLEDHITGQMHMNTKIWESARAGTFTITSRYNPLFEDYQFTETKDIVTYTDEDDLLEKFKFYIENQKEREKIRKSFIKKVKKNFDYEFLFEKFFKEINDNIYPNKVLSLSDVHSKIHNEEKDIVGIYYDIVWKSKPIKQFFPFVHPSSIYIFDTIPRNSLQKYLHLIINNKRFNHVKLLIKVDDKYFIFAFFNFIIFNAIENKLKKLYRKFFLPIKIRVFSA